MLNIKSKLGISLMVLVLTIILMLILASAVVMSVGNNLESSKLSVFLNEVSQVQDAVKSYYISNNVLPSDGIKLTKDDVTSLVESKYKSEFENEINLNSDIASDFYKIDLNLIEAENVRLEDGNSRKYVVSYPNLNVYSLEPTTVDNVYYFSITSKVDNIVKYNKNGDISNSKTNIVDGVNLNVSSNTNNYTNKLGIKVQVSNISASTDNIYLELTGISSQKEVSESFIDGFNFDTIEELNSKGILKVSLSNTEIEEFNNSQSKHINVVIKRDNNEIARENLDMSNYDISIPIITLVENKEYDNMRVLRFDISDIGSGVKGIRYDYLNKIDSSNNVVSYYEGITSFDEEYMLTKAKLVNDQNLVDGKTDIKIPKDVKTINVIALDKAGNNSSILNIDVQ